MRNRRGYVRNHLDRNGFLDLRVTAETAVVREAIRALIRYLDQLIDVRARFYRGEIEAERQAGNRRRYRRERLG